jgi:hypothetical protein
MTSRRCMSSKSDALTFKSERRLDEFQVLNFELQVLNFELHVLSFELQILSFKFLLL